MACAKNTLKIPFTTYVYMNMFINERIANKFSYAIIKTSYFYTG